MPNQTRSTETTADPTGAAADRVGDGQVASERRGPRVRFREFARGPIGGLLAFMASLYVRAVCATTRWRLVGVEAADRVLVDRRAVYAIWHGRIFVSPPFRPRHRRVVVMVSNNRDGDLIARFLAGFGFGVVRGSSVDPKKPEKARGGARAAAAGLRALRDGAVLAVIPDGPRGPAWRAKPGVAWIAAAGDAVVLPVGVSLRRGKVFDSWDRFVLPWPFNRGVIVYGEPIEPPGASASEEALETFRLAIETGLTEATRMADRMVGAVGVDPLAEAGGGVAVSSTAGPPGRGRS